MSVVVEQSRPGRRINCFRFRTVTRDAAGSTLIISLCLTYFNCTLTSLHFPSWFAPKNCSERFSRHFYCDLMKASNPASMSAMSAMYRFSNQSTCWCTERDDWLGSRCQYLERDRAAMEIIFVFIMESDVNIESVLKELKKINTERKFYFFIVCKGLKNKVLLLNSLLISSLPPEFFAIAI